MRDKHSSAGSMAVVRRAVGNVYHLVHLDGAPEGLGARVLELQEHAQVLPLPNNAPPSAGLSVTQPSTIENLMNEAQLGKGGRRFDNSFRTTRRTSCPKRVLPERMCPEAVRNVCVAWSVEVRLS